MYHGVPVIGIPFVTDQENNMVKAVADGYAIKLSWNSITEENLYSAILSLLSEPRYSCYSVGIVTLEFKCNSPN